MDPERIEDLASVEPGSLVEIAGRIEKNAIGSIIDCIDAISILSQMGSSGTTQQKAGGGGKKKGGGGQKSELDCLRDSLAKDRERTPFLNAIMRCSLPRDVSAIVTLRTENLRDLTLSELHMNSVRVLGKVTRVVSAEEEVCPFENYGMALLKPTILEEALDPIISSEGTDIELTEVRLRGPAIQILPLMVFV